MRAYVGILEDDCSPSVASRIVETFPGSSSFRISKNCYFVKSEGLSGFVAEKVGLKGDKAIEGASGIVFKLNSSYSGYADTGIWEWLSEFSGGDDS